jgi:hypothetical protein
VLITFLVVAMQYTAYAADLIDRRITVGSSFVSEVTTHRFTFSTATASNVGSIQFQYCANSPLFTDPCTAVPGLNVASAVVSAQSGLTGFSISGATTATNLVITRPSIAASPTTTSFTFSNIVNPSTPDSVVYVRISTYDNINATGALIDTGAVVFVVEDRFNIDAYVPPYLTFCTGVTVSLDCSNTAGFLVDFGEFNNLATSSITTQMSASTNDRTGYNIFISGQTMLSGSNIIPQLSTQTTSQIGVSQFGINLRSNTNPSVGANPEAGFVSSGSPAPNYDTPNLFRFASGDRVAGATTSTGFNKYTISYIVNVSEEQNPGTYATTLTYTAIASF